MHTHGDHIHVHRHSKSEGHRKSIRIDNKKKQKLRKADTVFIFDPMVHMNLTKLEKENLEKIKSYEKLKWEIEIAILQTGASFGELALINNEPRKATIMCLNECYFAVLEKQDYNKVLLKFQQKE